MSVQASHLHVDKSTNQFSQPKAGHEFLVVHLLCHNGGKKAQDYNPLFTLHLHGSVNQENYAGDAMDSNITMMGSGKLSPGQFIAGDVAFEVPTIKQTYTLLWDADYGQNAPITVPINA